MAIHFAMRSFFLIWLISLFAISSFKTAAFETYRIRGFTQGTSYQITYYGEEQAVSKKQIEAILGSIDSSLSLYKPYSLISRFNRAQEGLEIDAHMSRVVRKSLEVSKETAGAFDITIYPLVQAWGFGAESIASLPDSATVQDLLKCVGPDKIRLQENYLQKEKPCVKIDVNGIAQGYTVDVLGEFLEEKGIENYLVEVGGEIRLKGRKKPGGERMAIGIEGPGGNESQPYPIQIVIRPEYGAITTSGNYRKYVEADTAKFSHLVDPASGYPLSNEMISTTVWAKEAITADAYDNALMGMGIEKALEFAAQQKELEAFFIYLKADGSVADTATNGFYKLVR